MADILTFQFTADEEAKLNATIDSLASEMDKMFAEMKQTQENIDRLRQDSHERLDRIDAMLEKMAADR